MAKFKFNKDYRDKELKREVRANEPVEMTIKRADEVVKNIRDQSTNFEGYEDFSYERLDKPESEKKAEKKEESE